MAYITKRNDSYTIRVSCGRDVNGHKITRTLSWKPDKPMTEKQLQKELNRVAFDFEEKVKKGLIGSDQRMTFADFVPQYLELIKPSIAAQT